MGMLSLRINGSRPKEPHDQPLQDRLGLRGYTHRVRLHTPSDKETSPSLGTPQHRLGLGGSPKPQAPYQRHDEARALAPAWATTPVKAQPQEDTPRAAKARGLLDAARRARPCRPLPRQGYARGVT
jgi:hypothetical protein